MERVRMQPEFLRERGAAEDLARLREELRQARADAEAAVRSRDDILAIVSHDLRNPLNTIAMSLSLIEADRPHGRVPAQAGIIRRAIANMNRLIQDLLDVNQLAAGALVVRPEPVDAATLLGDARRAFGAIAERKSQRFEVHEPEGLRVLADRDRIGQVLSNLLGNAAKFTPEGGGITLSAEVQGREVLFRVRDTGPGIEAQDLPYIFERFWQVRRVRRGGVGLGLAISKGIVDAHAGRIWALSEPGTGSEFLFTLPRVEDRP